MYQPSDISAEAIAAARSANAQGRLPIESRVAGGISAWQRAGMPVVR
ncbi:hypothetical protein ACJ4V0_01015 [Phreatobacter sp. HK31-P]